MVVASMRAAESRSASGGIAWSSVATRYRRGRELQAGTPITSGGQSGQGLLDSAHDPCPDSVNIGREVLDEIIFWRPGGTKRVDVQVRERQGRGAR